MWMPPFHRGQLEEEGREHWNPQRKQGHAPSQYSQGKDGAVSEVTLSRFHRAAGSAAGCQGEGGGLCGSKLWVCPAHQPDLPAGVSLRAEVTCLGPLKIKKKKNPNTTRIVLLFQSFFQKKKKKALMMSAFNTSGVFIVFNYVKF